MGLSSRSVTVDDFFKKNLVENLAALFEIDESRIRVMDVISADGARRRRSTDLSYIDVRNYLVLYRYVSKYNDKLS